MPSPVLPFGFYLETKRKAARLSLREVGAATGLSHVYVREVERGERPPMRTEHWPALVKAIPGTSLADLERAAAVARPLEIDLESAPADYVELALALAQRVRARDLPDADLPALLGLLRAGGGPTVRAFGRVVTAAGEPGAGRAFVYRVAGARGWAALIGVRAHKGRTAGPLDANVATLTGKTVDLVAESDPRGGGFFDIPGGLPPGEYALDVHAPDGRQAWAWPLVVAEGVATQDVVIGGPPAAPSMVGGASGPGPGPVDVSKLPPVPPLEKHFTPGSFTASVSYYGLGGAPLDRIQRDLARFRGAGFGNARVWVDWTRPSDASRTFQRDGTPIVAQVRKLEAALDFAASLGMSFDLTLSSDHYDAIKRSSEGYDIAAHKKALAFLLAEFKGHPAIAFVDAANECNERGPGNSGNPKYGHVSPGRAKELFDVARAADPARRVTFSMTGDATTCAGEYAKFAERGTVIPLFIPHFPRKAGWGAAEGGNGKSMAAALVAAKSDFIAAVPLVHHQEPARRNYPNPGDAPWPVSEFEASFKSARAAGAVGCCFHTGACFDLTTRDGWDQLDEVEREVVAHVAAWIR